MKTNEKISTSQEVYFLNYFKSYKKLNLILGPLHYNPKKEVDISLFNFVKERPDFRKGK